jgi:hypothetical protein
MRAGISTRVLATPAERLISPPKYLHRDTEQRLKGCNLEKWRYEASHANWVSHPRSGVSPQFSNSHTKQLRLNGYFPALTVTPNPVFHSIHNPRLLGPIVAFRSAKERSVSISPRGSVRFVSGGRGSRRAVVRMLGIPRNSTGASESITTAAPDGHFIRGAAPQERRPAIVAFRSAKERCGLIARR